MFGNILKIQFPNEKCLIIILALIEAYVIKVFNFYSVFDRILNGCHCVIIEKFEVK